MKRITYSLLAFCFVATSAMIFSSCKEKDPDPVVLPLEPPTITLISPTKGTAATVVTITGTNFSATTASNVVKFNGKAATVNSATSNQLVVAVPADAGTGKVSVITDGGSVEGPEFIYFSVPNVTAIDPASAKFNASVVISGTDFDPASVTVKINDKPVTVTASTATQLTVTIPKGLGTGQVTVLTTGGNIDGPIFNYVPIVTVSTLAGSGVAGFTDGTGTGAQFNGITGIAFDSQDNLYVCERQNHRVRKITTDGVTSTFAGSTQGSSDGTGVLAQFNVPSGITADGQGNFYVTDAGSGKIRKITADGVVTTIAGSGTPGFADGVGAAASFNFPTNLTMDVQGDLIVADFSNNRLRRVTTSGIVTTFAGNGSSDFVEGNGTAAHIGSVWGIIRDNRSNFYFSNFSGGRILKMNSLGDIASFAGDGTSAFADGAAQSAKFISTYGIVIDKNGDFIVCDGLANRIRRISNGVVSTIAGDGTAGLVNGDGSVARFNLPFGLAMNSKGEIFVSDRTNHAIRKIVLE